MHRRTLLVLASAILLTAPAASATWYFGGSYEPTTSYDTSEWMWQGPAPAGASQLYFAVFSQSLVVTNPADANPNVGVLHTDIEVSNAEHHEALLGVWKDCNGDGYVGLAESAVREYPANLLSSTAVCPLVEGPALTWTAGAHNYNGWVSELIPIGRDGAIAADKRMYLDDDARVWGDYQRPDEDPYTRQCVVAPQPRGTYQTTGGFLTYADCRADILGGANLVFSAIGDPLGATWTDNDDGSSGSLGHMQTFGDEDEANRAVTVWDCSDNTFRVGDAINATPLPEDVRRRSTAGVNNTAVPILAPNVEDTSDPNTHVAGQANHTLEGSMVLMAATDGDAYDCDYSNDQGNDVYEGTCGVTVYCVGEGDRAIVNPKNKTVAAWNLGFVTGARGTAPWAAAIPLRWNGPSGPPGATDMIAWEGSRWQADSYWSTKPGFSTVRTDLENAAVGIAPAYWLSFYAHVGTTTTNRGFLLPSNSVGKYGVDQCGDFDTGIHHGWNCDVSLWNRNPDGTPIDDDGATDLEYDEMVLPGQSYELRDVDCYDGNVRGLDPNAPLGVGVQPAFYGPEPCEH